MIIANLKEVIGVSVGNTEIKEVWAGDSKVFPDGPTPPAPSGYYYIYRTSSNIIERRDIAQYPKVNFPAIAGNNYGGVFTDYGGKGTIATALANGDPVTFVDDMVQDDGSGYIGELTAEGSTKVFEYSNAITTGTTAYTPTVGTIYFIREIPDWILIPYNQLLMTSDRSTLRNLLVISGLDSFDYNSIKLHIKKEEQSEFEVFDMIPVRTLTVQTYAGGSTITLKSSTVYASFGCPDNIGYLGYYDIFNLIEANSTYIIYYELITPDGISVVSPWKRKLIITTLTKTGVTKEDIPFEPITYDAQVEYIETSSTNCNIPIDETNSNGKFEIDAYIPSTTSAGWLFGSMLGVDNLMYAFTPCDENGLSSYKCGNVSSSTEPKLEGRYTFSNVDNKKICVVTNGTDTITYSTDSVATSNKLLIYLLGLNENGGGRQTIEGIKLYSAKFYNYSGSLRKDLIPVRKNGRGYLYDNVDKLKLYAPKGDPITVYGADVVE